MKHILLYFIIFISKVIENTLGTLRLIVVANGKKIFGAILQFLISLVWILVTGVVIIGINKDPLKIIFFAFGSLVGSYAGSLIEEKMALGNSLVIATINSNNMETVTKLLKKYKVISLEEKIKDKNLLLLMVSRKQINIVITIIKKYEGNSIIILENARTIKEYRKRND